MVSIHCFLNNFVNNVDIEPSGHVFRIMGIRLHPTGVFSNNVDAKEATWSVENVLSSHPSKSDCSEWRVYESDS